MEGHTSEIVRQSAKEMDKALAPVMPKSWIGHARLVIMDSQLSEEREQKALNHTENVLDDNPEYPADRVAEKVVEKLE
jgi:hypothetical protein